MSKVTSELVRAEAAALRGAVLDEDRAAQLAADMNRLQEAVLGAREHLDFNDEPARFAALLAASTVPARKRR